MESRPALVLQNVSLPDGRVADITIADGTVRHIGAGIPADRVIDCTGLFVLPAATDMHVHMRGGVQSAKEDWESGTKSALAGGVTVVVDQPNTVPPVTRPETLRARVFDAKEKSFCHFAINSGVTHDTPLPAMWSAGAMAFGEVFFAPSSYGEAVTPQELGLHSPRSIRLAGLQQSMRKRLCRALIPRLNPMRRSALPEGELRAVRAVLHANTAGCRLHFCHMSTGASVDAARGSVEATPHHLFLSREMFEHTDAFAKVNPPLRSEQERKELLSRWERIDVIASDHAPHTRPEKEQPFSDAPSGVPGVETMMPLLLAAVLEKTISLPDVIAKTSSNPGGNSRDPAGRFCTGIPGGFCPF